MVDAYQNRSIPHIDCVKMLYRASFFKKLWKTFLTESGYSEVQYFISQEADDIMDIFVNGYFPRWAWRKVSPPTLEDWE
jgi:hypothetical protein